MSPGIAIVKRNIKNNEGKDELKEIELNVKDLSIADIVIVKSGDKILIDGTIVKGIISVDQSSIIDEN